MTKRTVPAEIEDLDWQSVMDLFPKQWVALRIDELSDEGVKSGSLIARGKDEYSVRAKLRQFRTANPGVKFALFNTLPLKPKLDVLLTWPP